jgi:hypothetical protein
MERDERLRQIYERGDQLRRGRLRWRAAGIGTLAIALAMAVAPVLAGDDATDEIRMVDSTSTTNPGPEHATTTTSSPAASATTAVAAAEPICSTVDSDESDPPGEDQNADEPLAVEACVTSRVKVGQAAVLTIHALDPDARLADTIGNATCAPHVVWWGDEDSRCESTPGCAEPTSPPTPERGEASYEIHHTYATPGTYRVEVDVMSGDPCEFTYSDRVQLTLTVVVT